MNAIFTKRKFTNSLTSKLTLFVALASGLTLLISCAAFVFNDVLILRHSKVRELTSIAEVMASNSTAVLAFGQVDAAEELLATLSDRSDITTARLFDSEGALFASYTAPATAESDANVTVPETMGYNVAYDGRLEVALPVFDQGEHLGSVQLRAATGGLQGQMHRYGGIATSVILASLLVSIVLEARLQRFVSDPLLQLATVVQQVKEDGDYSVRVEKPSNDEIGELYDEFNSMLAQIDFADAARQGAHEELRTTNAGLEERVRERTDQLLQANAELELSQNRLRAIVESVRGSEVTDLNKVLAVVNEYRDDLPGFMETDRRGKQLPKDLIQAGRALERERDSVLERLNGLTKSIEHIKEIVGTQRSYADVGPGESHASA